ncbi:hypothetical protein V8D89_015848 [Ganoderma adspersum]
MKLRPTSTSIFSDDGRKLFGDFGLLPAGLVELGALGHSANLMFRRTYNCNIVAC